MAGYPLNPTRRRDEAAPDYQVTAEQVAQLRAGRRRPPGAFWCNVCNASCETEAVLRAHYREEHPELAARLEAQRPLLPD